MAVQNGNSQETNEKTSETSAKKGGGLKKLLLIPLLPVLTFVIFVFLFSSLFGVDINMALNPPDPPDSVTVLIDEETQETSKSEKSPPSDSAWAELEEKKQELELMQEELKSSIEKRDAARSEDAKALARLYDGIKQEQLAYIFEHMDDTLIVRILPQMKAQNASKVLEYMNPERAARISRMILSR